MVLGLMYMGDLGRVRATLSLGSSLGFFYQLNFNIILSRLTLTVDQFV